jgi:hypothetical protein
VQRVQRVQRERTTLLNVSVFAYRYSVCLQFSHDRSNDLDQQWEETVMKLSWMFGLLT